MQQSNIYIISYSLNNCIKIKNYTILFIHFKFISSSFFYLRRKESKRNHRRLIHENIQIFKNPFERKFAEKRHVKFFQPGRRKKKRKNKKQPRLYRYYSYNVTKRRYRGALLTDIGDFDDAFRAPTLINCLGS